MCDSSYHATLECPLWTQTRPPVCWYCGEATHMATKCQRFTEWCTAEQRLSPFCYKCMRLIPTASNSRAFDVTCPGPSNCTIGERAQPRWVACMRTRLDNGAASYLPVWARLLRLARAAGGLVPVVIPDTYRNADQVLRFVLASNPAAAVRSSEGADAAVNLVSLWMVCAVEAITDH